MQRVFLNLLISTTKPHLMEKILLAKIYDKFYTKKKQNRVLKHSKNLSIILSNCLKVSNI